MSWFGVACEVRLMGSFDGWTRGVDLSAEELSDSVYTEFEAELVLLPVRTLYFHGMFSRVSVSRRVRFLGCK